MKKLIIILLLVCPLYLFSNNRVKGYWFDVRTHKTIGFQSRHSISNSKLYKSHKTAKSIKKLQRKWDALKK